MAAPYGSFKGAPFGQETLLGRSTQIETLEQNAALLLGHESNILKEQRISEAAKTFKIKQKKGKNKDTRTRRRAASPTQSDIPINSSPVSTLTTQSELENENRNINDTFNEAEFGSDISYERDSIQKIRENRERMKKSNKNETIISTPSISQTMTDDMSSIYDSNYSHYSYLSQTQTQTTNIAYNIQNGTGLAPMTVGSMLEPRWSTANWTAIFMQIHSLQRRTNIHIGIFLFGIFLIVGLIVCELLFFQGNSLLFTRISDWTMLGLFLYIIIAIISLSKYSNKNVCILRDYMYVIEWINSILCLIVGISMILPFDFHASYIDCINNDTKCDRYEKDRPNSSVKQTIVFAVLIVSHSFEIIYILILSITFDHRYSLSICHLSLLCFYSLANGDPWFFVVLCCNVFFGIFYLIFVLFCFFCYGIVFEIGV